MAVGKGLVSYGKCKAGIFFNFGTIGEAGDSIRDGMQDFREEGVVYRGCVERLGDLYNSRTILEWGVAHSGVEKKIGERQWK